MIEPSQVIKARLGERLRIWYNRPKFSDSAAPRFAVRPFYPEPFSPLEDVQRLGRPHIAFYDLATGYAQVDPNVRIGWALIQATGQALGRNETRDFINGYLEMDSEILSNFGMPLRLIREAYLVNHPFDYSEAANSEGKGRKLSNTWPLMHACGGLFLDTTFYSKDSAGSEQSTRRFILQPGQSGWEKVRPIGERRASWEGIRAALDSPESRAERERIDEMLRLEDEEEWLSYQTGITYQKEGRLIPVSLGGSYYLRLDSPFYYEPFDTGDEGNYKMTREPDYYAETVPSPRITIGANVSSEHRVFMVPQYWRMQVTFKAWYLFFTYWSFTFVVIPFTFVFLNRFPLFPRPFVLGSTDYPPIWQWIERSKAHGRMVSAVHALEFITPIMAMVFVFTSDGSFDLRRTDTFPGSLAAALEIGGRKYYVWRRTGTERDLSIPIDQGPVNTYLINSWGAEMLGGVPGNEGGVPI